MRRGLLCVAHPDDESLWFGGTLLSAVDVRWTVLCATYGDDTPRGRDFRGVCQRLGAQAVQLGLPDSTGLLPEPLLRDGVSEVAEQGPFDVVLTHGRWGEYGHPHHRQVSRMVRERWPNAMESGFGAPRLTHQVPLSAAVRARKKRLLERYVSEGKSERVVDYPAWDAAFEPLFAPDGAQPALLGAEPVEPRPWREIGGRWLAHRRTPRVRRVALLADSPRWAHQVIAEALARSAPRGFEVDVHHLFEPGYDRPRARAADILDADYDVIHLLSWRHWPVVEGWGLPPERLVTTIHGHRETERGGGAHLRAVLGHFAAASVVSARLRSALAPHVGPQRLLHTPCGVDTQRFTPRQDPDGGGPLRCLSVGRDYGGADDIKGWRRILNPLASRGAPTRYLQADRGFALEPHEMPAYYRSGGCYLCGSRSEGNPLPLLEAAAAGLPLITTDVGIAPELVVDGENGWIVTRDLAAFERALAALDTDRSLAQRMGRRSRERALARDWALVAGRWAALWGRVA